VTLLRSLLALLLALAGTLLWPGPWADRGFVPDFLLLAALGAGLFATVEAAVAAGVAAGLLVGLASLEPFGLDAALLAAVALFAGRVRAYFAATHPAVQALLALGSCSLLSLLRILRMAAAGAPPAASDLLPLMAGAVATALAAPVVLFVIEALRIFRGPRPPEGRPQLV
jgi:rod shape-determining protein MreD